MAQYSNTSKPAFYVPFCDYMQSLGNIEYKDDSWNDIHLLNPTKTHTAELPANGITYDVDFTGSIQLETITDSDGYVYFFILGHNLHTINASIEIDLLENGSYHNPSPSRLSIINDNGAWSSPSYNGFTIYKAKYSVSNVEGYRIKIYNNGDSVQNVKLGCVSLCSKWNPSHSPDLSLTMTRQYDGVRTTQTNGGATLSNASYTRGGTFWATSYAWELTTGEYEQGTEPTIEMQRTLGRRIWNLSFSYLSDSTLMPKTESLNHYETTLTANTDTILHSQSFFSRVLNRLQGSHIPFIFQPNDSDPNKNPDQWAISRLTSEAQLEQVANNTYNVSMNITESW